MTGVHAKKIETKQKVGKKRRFSFSTENTDRDFKTQCINHEHERLVQWLKTVKFRKVLFGGVDEAQLWKKLEELNRLYEAAIRAERARYDTLIHTYTEKYNAEILRYQQDLAKQGSEVNSNWSQNIRRQREEQM